MSNIYQTFTQYPDNDDVNYNTGYSSSEDDYEFIDDCVLLDKAKEYCDYLKKLSQELTGDSRTLLVAMVNTILEDTIER